jgi:hypothetical protein
MKSTNPFHHSSCQVCAGSRVRGAGRGGTGLGWGGVGMGRGWSGGQASGLDQETGFWAKVSSPTAPFPRATFRLRRPTVIASGGGLKRLGLCCCRRRTSTGYGRSSRPIGRLSLQTSAPCRYATLSSQNTGHRPPLIFLLSPLTLP